MTPRQIEQLRDQLVGELVALYRGVHGELRESMLRELFDPDEPRDEVDESQRTQLSDTGVRLAEADAARAQLMEEALRRIRHGDFGQCVDCGQAIAIERLRLVPWTLRCVDCQETHEAGERLRPPTL